jgi:serine protease inhibitor
MLAWSGDDRFRLTVTTLDMNVVGAYQYTALETKIQVVDFPLSNDESGMYIINVEYVNAKRKEDILVI